MDILFHTKNLLTILLKNFVMTHPCLPVQWNVSMSFAGTSIPTFSKILEKVFSRSLAGALWGILAFFPHSCREYWALTHHCLSMLTSRSDNSSLNCLTSFFMSCWIDLFLSWRFTENAIVLVLQVCWVILLIIFPWLKTANSL